MQISCIQRAQVMIELLASNEPQVYQKALNRIRHNTGKFDFVGRLRSAHVDLNLPTDPKRLLRELQNHLKAITVSYESTNEDRGLCLALLQDLPLMPAEFESEWKHPEVPPRNLKDRPLEEETIQRVSCNNASDNGFDLGILIQIGGHPLGPEPVIANILDLEDEFSQVQDVRNIHLSNRGFRLLGERTVEFLDDGSQPLAWNLVVIIRIRPDVVDKRGFVLQVMSVIENIKCVTKVVYLKAWESGLNSTHYWTVSGREILSV